MSEHTPTPWAVDDIAADPEGFRSIFGKRGSFDVLTADATSLEDAAFIVLACNSHDELVAALKAVVAIADRKTVEFDRAHAILAKVEAS